MRVLPPCGLSILCVALAISVPAFSQTVVKAAPLPSAEEFFGDKPGRPESEQPSSNITVQVVPAQKTRADIEAERRDNARKADIEAKSLATNMALAGFAFLQLVVTCITLVGLRHAKTSALAAAEAADAAKGSIDHLKLIERAYVFGGIVDVAADPETGATSFNFVVHNSGRTPARVREVHIGLKPDLELDPSKWPETADYREAIAYATDTIFEGGARSPQIEFKDEPTVGVVYGYILYEDVFQRRHTSRFCMSYSGIEGRAATYGNDDWNRYD